MGSSNLSKFRTHFFSNSLISARLYKVFNTKFLTDQCFVTRLDEHGSQYDQPMFQHLVNCQQFLEELSILNLPTSDNNIPEVELNSHIMNAVHYNSKILDYNNNWSQLCLLEAFYIKTLKPKINAGLKASKELQLFK